jgi:hypothetical protein
MLRFSRNEQKGKPRFEEPVKKGRPSKKEY